MECHANYDGIGNPLSYYNGQSYIFTWQERRTPKEARARFNWEGTLV
ncbi:MAG: hypothetical protein IJ398_00125 [Clostridia bacterium]|nr:hypothetical protein [Clostridia bacterium]